MRWVSISEVLEKPISGEWGTEAENSTEGIPVIRNTNFSNDGRIDLHDVAFRKVDNIKVEKKKLKIGDIIIEKSGGSETQPVGRVVYFDIDDGQDYLYSNFTSALRPKSFVESKYVHYALLHSYLRGGSELFQNKTTGIRNLQLNRYLQKLKIPLPTLEEQKAIVAKLDRAQRLIDIDKEMLAKYDQLIQSVFLDMFGDPVTNPKGWELQEFGNHIKTLTDYHANGSYKILSKNVTLKDNEDYALMVRTTDLENKNFTEGVKYIDEHAYNFLEKTKVYGNEIIMNKIGSAGNVYLMPKLNRPVSLGMNAFMLRFKDTLNIKFIYYQLLSDYGEFEIKKRVKGAVTKTIRKDAVREIPIIVPPITEQNEFELRVLKIKEQKIQTKKSLAKSEELFSSLVQEVFG